MQDIFSYENWANISKIIEKFICNDESQSVTLCTITLLLRHLKVSPSVLEFYCPFSFYLSLQEKECKKRIRKNRTKGESLIHHYQPFSLRKYRKESIKCGRK